MLKHHRLPTVFFPLVAVATTWFGLPPRATAQTVSLKATSPALLSPAHASKLTDLPNVLTLSVGNAAGIYVSAVFDYRFEVYNVTNGMALVSSAVVNSGANTTTYAFAGPFAYSTVYQWRVRAELDSATGPWSTAWNFETPKSQAGPLTFTDITLATGLGSSQIPLGGHGAAFADATGNQRPDLYITMNFDVPQADLFFAYFERVSQFVESGAARGIADFDAGSHGAVWGDLDNDGDFDLVNGTTGTGEPNNIFRNDGAGVFTDATPPSVRGRDEATRGVAVFDMDRDGDLDIFAVSGWMGSGDPSSERNELYRNDGNLQFSSVTSGAAYTAPAGQGVTDTDFDGDGDVDLIAANRDGDLNVLRNDGLGNFTLVPPDTIGIQHSAFSGITMGDIDTDGDLDMVIVGLDAAGETVGHLYCNLGAGQFGYLRAFTNFDGYMGGFTDVDHDRDLDLLFAGDDVVYLNDGSGSFSTGPAIPISAISDPRAIVFADIDNDGDIDFAVAAKRSRNWLVRNNLNRGNWLKIRLISPQGQTGAFGAKISIYDATAAGMPPLAIRESRSNNGYLAQNDPVLHVGLGTHTLVNVIATFLDGTTRVLSNVRSNQTVTINGSTGGSAPVFVEQHRYSSP